MIKLIWLFLKGKKTYIVGILGLLYGISVGDTQLVLTSLGLMGLRNAL